ncbi:hypothetical protein R3P38DRAFT_3225436 [Favolaschia claudopus]|uniref:Uncharacterized protein n=1 Tax=Favolaschia claudopus TaxID=2862362 RepID=A0AAV9ZUW4_9AGAR
MSAIPASRLAREFIICVILSFFIVLGLIHGLLHFLHAGVASGIVVLHSPLAKHLVGPAIQLSQIAQLHGYLLAVFKVTMACSALIFAVRELVSGLGLWTGWWDLDSAETSSEGLDELEAGLSIVDVKEATIVWTDEKLTDLSQTHFPHPYPNNTAIF